jgi:hypothetical protein
MLADFANQISERNEAGQVTRDWNWQMKATVKNITEGILGGGIRVVGSTETWGEDYEEVEWAKMYIGSQEISLGGQTVFITRRFRVRNIRDELTGRTLWVGDDGLPIEFNIMGITPIVDPFGRPLEYEILLKGITDD